MVVRLLAYLSALFLDLDQTLEQIALRVTCRTSTLIITGLSDRLTIGFVTGACRVLLCPLELFAMDSNLALLVLSNTENSDGGLRRVEELL